MKFALLGAHLSHSHSPLIHSEIYKDFNIEATYEKIECEPNELEGLVNKIRTGEYTGYNVTIPYKIEIMQYLDEIDEKAKAIGSVNTIALKDGKVVGYNTDYYGFLKMVEYFKVDVKDNTCAVLGTGGASLAIRKVLKDLGGNIKLVSRHPEGNEISYDDLAELNPSVIVNTTPVGMYPNVGKSPIDASITRNAKYVLDIIFNPRQTQLLLDANSKMDGLFMLVGQAVKAEEIWLDKEYDKSLEDLLNRIEARL